jgi:hypothetical protein
VREAFTQLERHEVAASTRPRRSPRHPPLPSLASPR